MNLHTRMSYAGTAGRVAGPALLAVVLTACASTASQVDERLGELLPADAILLGEQHDAPAHQILQRGFVDALAQRRQLAALVLEMAERGNGTANLAPDATPRQVQDALRWNDAGWPWERYAPVVMAAVRQGVPVLGANLARAAMRPAMADTQFDNHLAAAALERQREAIRIGHCDMLPAERLMPMVRIQLARDASMAAAVAGAVVPGKIVLLVAGGGHVTPELGVPTHLPPHLRVRTVLAIAGDANTATMAKADMVWRTRAVPPRDHCAELAQQLKR